MRIAPSPVRLSKDGSETRDAGAHLNCLARPPNLEFLRVLQTHFHPQLLRQNLGKQQKQQFPKVFQSSSFLMMKRKFATKTKTKQNKKTNTAAAISQCSNNKPQKKEPINRSPVPLSRLHSTRTIHTSRNLTDSEKKKDRSPDLLTTTGFVAAKTKLRDDACQPAAKIVFQNGLKTKTDRKKKKKNEKKTQH